jgi:hypothetical protein
MSMKNSNDIIGNGTRDLPACSAVPQPTAPPRTLLPDIASRNNNAVLVSVMLLHRTTVQLINRKLIFAHTDVHVCCGQCQVLAV